MKTTKLKEIICYEENNVRVLLEVDYAYNKISLIEHTGNGIFNKKNYLFAGRGVEYMNGWVNVLQVMQNAIKQAKKMYEQELAAESRFKEKKEINIVMALDKKNKKK